ncbi:MAG: 30S ribosomal protein S8, partial [Cetobacterium sp.]
ISNYKIVTDGNKKNIRVYLKYDGKERVIKGIKRISKPGRRVYSSVEDMPRVLSGLGIAIVSTSKGIVTDRTARRENMGGEILAFVW